MILADENIDARIIVFLRKAGVNVLSVKEHHSGIKDEEVISLSKNPPRIILTEDKDFGEWVYAHDEKEISVILLRYDSRDIKTIQVALADLIKSRSTALYGKYITLTVNKIRIRSLK